MSAGTGEPLGAARELFEHFDREGVRYCHWKSNANLLDGLTGRTDLDVLVHPDDAGRAREALRRRDFLELRTPAARRLPGASDHLGFDAESGRLLHVHLHGQLVLGQAYAKNHHLPMEEALVERVRTLHGVRAPQPELELLLLVIRASMRLRVPRMLAFALGAVRSPHPPAIASEFAFLLRDLDVGAFRSALHLSGLPWDEELLLAQLADLSRGTPRLARTLRVRSHVYRCMRPLLLHPPGRARRRAAAARLRYSLPVRRLLPPPAKQLAGGGRVLALVGADGAGKTTQLEALGDWLGWKLEVRRFYLGIPRTPLLRAAALAVAALRRAGATRLAGRLSARRWLVVARRRARTVAACRRFAERGGIALADRHPLPHFSGMSAPMDGPRIRAECPDADPRLAEREEACYAAIRLPDRVFVLKADLPALRARKDDLPAALHAEKVAAVNAIAASPALRPVDAGRPADAVLRELKRAVWEALR